MAGCTAFCSVPAGANRLSSVNQTPQPSHPGARRFRLLCDQRQRDRVCARFDNRLGRSSRVDKGVAAPTNSLATLRNAIRTKKLWPTTRVHVRRASALGDSTIRAGTFRFGFAMARDRVHERRQRRDRDSEQQYRQQQLADYEASAAGAGVRSNLH